jgi:hypothetical protein
MRDRIDGLGGSLRRRVQSAGQLVTGGAAAMSTAAATRADPRVRALCPIDDWEFKPLYTDGTCPLCGWAPPAYVHRPPLFHRLDWFWAGMGAMAIVSVAMLIAVLNAYGGG